MLGLKQLDINISSHFIVLIEGMKTPVCNKTICRCRSLTPHLFIKNYSESLLKNFMLLCNDTK